MSFFRWFSCQGWSSGPCPIVLPHSLRSGFSTDVDDGNTTRAGSWSRERKKETKTIFDIVSHLCGKAVPGIPQNISMPNDLIERLKQLHWMYATLLTFLRYAEILKVLFNTYKTGKQDLLIVITQV